MQALFFTFFSNLENSRKLTKKPQGGGIPLADVTEGRESANVLEILEVLTGPVTPANRHHAMSAAIA